jgi:hypothetical protein
MTNPYEPPVVRAELSEHKPQRRMSMARFFFVAIVLNFFAIMPLFLLFRMPQILVIPAAMTVTIIHTTVMLIAWGLSYYRA